MKLTCCIFKKVFKKVYFLKVNKMVSHFIRITISRATHSVFKFQKSVFLKWLLVMSNDSVPTISHTAGARQTWILEPSAVLTRNIFLPNSMKFSSQRCMITLVNKDFVPREKSLFLMYFWMLNSNMFPEFLYHPHLSLQVKGLESSAPGH
jgi:hypothetical protein